jgi:hypothetical protein
MALHPKNMFILGRAMSDRQDSYKDSAATWDENGVL